MDTETYDLSHNAVEMILPHIGTLVSYVRAHGWQCDPDEADGRTDAELGGAVLVLMNSVDVRPAAGNVMALRHTNLLAVECGDFDFFCSWDSAADRAYDKIRFTGNEASFVRWIAQHASSKSP